MSVYRSRFNPVIVLTAIYGLVGLSANLAHPVTPTLLKSLNMPGYMFGLAFAVMQFSNFLFSPFWGNLCNYIQPRIILLIGCIGYAIGQAVFGFATTQTTILIGRALSGAFVSAASIGSIYVLVKITTPETRKSSLPLLVTSFVVMGTFGQFLGGVVGDANLYVPFYIQITMLILCGMLYYQLIAPIELESIESHRELIKKSNPIQSFVSIKDHLNILFIVQFLTVFLLSFASTSLSQTFGYYVVDVLKLGSKVNGVARGIVGLISLVLNTTLTIRIVRSKKTELNVMLVILGTAISIVTMTLFPLNIVIFIIGTVVALSFDTIIVSVMQDLSSAYATSQMQGIVVGTHNSMKSLGAVLGAMVSGFVYDVNVIYPFALSLGIYLICALTVYGLSKLKNFFKTDPV